MDAAPTRKMMKPAESLAQEDAPARMQAQAETQAQKQELARTREQTGTRARLEMQAREAELAPRPEARTAPAPAALPEATAGRALAAPMAPAAPPPPALAGNVAGRAETAGAMAPAATSRSFARGHQQLLAARLYAEALEALANPDTPDQIVDRDLLLQFLQPGHTPACATASGLGWLALLCDGLRKRAAGQPTTASWRAELEASGLVSGSNAYRRDLVDKVFGAAVP